MKILIVLMMSFLLAGCQGEGFVETDMNEETGIPDVVIPGMDIPDVVIPGMDIPEPELVVCSGYDGWRHLMENEWENVFFKAPEEGGVKTDCFSTTVVLADKDKGSFRIFYPGPVHRGTEIMNPSSCFCRSERREEVVEIAVVLINGPERQRLCYNVTITKC